jgi:DMSO/TMAO reductase YedYZ heme-binding membrane subunit
VTHRGRVALKVVVWAICLAPIAALGWWTWTADLTANPISFVTNTLGDWTLRILLASLAMTPLRIVFGLSWPISLRRLLGLFAFFYVSLHFLVWLVLDHSSTGPRWAPTSSSGRMSPWAWPRWCSSYRSPPRRPPG